VLIHLLLYAEIYTDNFMIYSNYLRMVGISLEFAIYFWEISWTEALIALKPFFSFLLTKCAILIWLPLSEVIINAAKLLKFMDSTMNA
jgi:hypothetical protein